MNKWQLNRIGLVNFWYYDDESFDFVDGKMLLTGNNGAGKSLTMQSFIPFLLDGNMKPERLDTFRTKNKQMRNYLLEEDSDKEERTGYLYMEFKRKDMEEYKTLGIGLQAKKSGSMKSWFFILNGPKRVGADFSLYKKIGSEKRTLSQKQLQNQIENFGEVIENQGDYIKKVNELFFGFETVEEYKELLDLLIKIRSPKLSNEFKPTAMIEILNSSLQVLPDEYIRQGADIIKQMDEQKNNLEDLNRKLEAFERLSRNFDNYNKKILLSRTERYIKILKENRKKEKDLSQNKLKLETATENLEVLENKGKLLEQEKSNLIIKKRSLEKNDVFKLEEEKNELEKINKEKENEKEDKEERLEKSEKKLRNKEDELRNYERNKAIYLKEMTSRSKEMEDLIKDYDFIEFSLIKDNIFDFKNEFNKSSYRKWIDKQILKLIKAKEIIREFEEDKKSCDIKYAEVDKEKNLLEDKKNLKIEYERQFEEIKQELINKIYLWSEGNKEFYLEGEELDKIVNYIYTYDDKSEFEYIKNIIFNSFENKKGQLISKQRDLYTEIQDKEKNYKELENKIKDLKEKKEPEPERSEAVRRNRKELEKLKIPYIEFYKYIDFEEKLPPFEKDKIEEALMNMGLLDSVVIEKKYREQVLGFGTGMCDKYIFVENFEKNKKIEFGNFEDLIVLDSDGNYRLGNFEGNISGEYKNIFIGLEERKRYIEKEIKSYEIELINIKKELDELLEKNQQLEMGIEILEKEKEHFPKSDDLLVALRGVKDCDDTIEKIIKNLNRIELELEKLLSQFQLKKSELFSYSKENRIPMNMEKLEIMIEDFKDYSLLYNDLTDANEGYRLSNYQIESISEGIEETSENISDLKLDIKKIKEEIEQKSQRIKDIIIQLETDDMKNIQEQIKFCLVRLEEIDEEKEDISKNIGLNINESKNLKDKITELKEELEFLLGKEECSRKIFLREVELGDYTLASDEEKDIEILANKIYENLKDTRLPKNVEDNLQKVFSDSKGELTQYSPNLQFIYDEENEYDLEERRYEITTKFNGEQYKFKTLLELLRENANNLKNLLREKDRELFKDILGKQINQKLRRMIEESKKWVKKIDEIMYQTESFGSGLKFSLSWKNKPGETEEEIDSNSLVELLGKDIEILKEEDKIKLSKHFQSKITLARRRNESKNNHESFYSIIKDILDYRKWFEFQLKFEKTGERKKELTDREFSKLSGGEKAMAMYIPLFSAAVAKYDGARKDAPRIIALDEAFAGIDNKNIESLFKMMSTLEFNYILTSQALWGTFNSAKSLAIYMLLRHNNSKFVTVINYIWNGDKLEME